MKPKPLLEGTEGQWQKVDGPTLEKSLARMRKVVPTGGTSLENAFNAIKTFNPAPDNVIVITDGLPTQGDTAPTFKKLVDDEMTNWL